jgi:hypothetical protein
MKPTVLPETFLRRMSPEDRKPLGPAGRTMAECDEANAVKYERELQKDIANYLRQKNVTFIQSRMDKRTRNTKGCPDFLFAISGRAIAIEAKRPGGTLRPDQDRMRLGLLRDGWRHLTVFTLQEVVELFKT